MRQYPHILQRVFDAPLLIHEPKLQTILSVLAPRADFHVETTANNMGAPERQDIQMALQGPGRRVGWSKNGYLMVNNTAILEIIGSLVHRGDSIDAMSGLTSYELLSSRLARMATDDEVTSILMVIDSFGGEATSGVFDLADQVRRVSKEKPIHGFAHDVATSAAYMIGSAATSLYLPEMGIAGSVGVVTAHLDISKKAEKDGVAVTFIYAGEHKIDGNQFEPLPKAVRKKIQSEVDRVYGMFVGRVAAFREMTEESVRATEAAIFHGQAAVDIGFADGVMPFEEYLGTVVDTESGNRAGTGLSTSTNGDSIMSDKDANAGSPAPENKPVILTAEQVREQHPEAAAELTKTATQAGAQEERQRISAILQHDNAQGRETLAAHIAFSTEMNVKDAAGMLAATPVAETTIGSPEKPAKTPFEQAMESADNPDIGSDDEDGDMTPAATASAMVEQARKMGLVQ